MLNAGAPAMHGASGFFNYAGRWLIQRAKVVVAHVYETLNEDRRATSVYVFTLADNI